MMNKILMTKLVLLHKKLLNPTNHKDFSDQKLHNNNKVNHNNNTKVKSHNIIKIKINPKTNTKENHTKVEIIIGTITNHNIKAVTKTGIITNHNMVENHSKVEIKTSIMEETKISIKEETKTSKKETDFVCKHYLFPIFFCFLFKEFYS